MDTSKEYIKMCEKSPKLQPHDLEFENGEYIIYKGKWGIYFNASFYLEGTFNEGFIDYGLNPFRIHIQDQLQEMVRESVGDPVNELIVFYNWCNNGYTSVDGFSTMEQLWLAFAMKEKFNKIWNGEDWIKS